MKSSKFKKLITFLLIVLTITPLAIPQNADAAIKINKKSKTMYVGSSMTLKITGTKKYIMWKSSDSKVASVSKKGKVKANSPGTATITATVGSGSNNKKLSCKIKVKPRLSANTYKVTCPLDEFQEVTVTFNKAKENETIVPIISDNDIASLEFGDTVGNKHTLYIIPEKRGAADIKIYTVQNAHSFNDLEINTNEYITIKVYIGIAEDSEWINSSDLSDIYSVDFAATQTTLTIIKRSSDSLSGITKKAYTIELKSSFENEVVYGTDLRYKYVDNQILLNISDLIALGFID